MLGGVYLYIIISTFSLQADENSDLQYIPSQISAEKTAEKAKVESSSSFSRKIYIEEALTGWLNRTSLLVPVPTGVNLNWQSRTSADANATWQLNPDLTFRVADRFNLFAQTDLTWFNRGTVRNDLKEIYVTYELSERTYLEAGRVNVRNGVALGFNPTDFFRVRSLVSQASIDPSSVRENRLGTLVIEAQKLWNGGSFTLGFSPGVQNASPLTLGFQDAFDLRFGQTNSGNRMFAVAAFDGFEVSPQALFYIDESSVYFGLNLSRTFGSSIVGYLEWSGSQRGTLSSRAIAFGQSTGTLPAGFPLIPQTQGTPVFQNDLSIGVSWTSKFKLSVNLEYHFHQSGFSGSDFSNWISTGTTTPSLASALWYIRQYAQDQREPLMQSEWFLRLDYPDVLIEHLGVGGIAFVNPYDGSLLAQFSTQYFASYEWTLGLYFTSTLGSERTEYGSLPYGSVLTAQIVRYL